MQKHSKVFLRIVYRSIQIAYRNIQKRFIQKNAVRIPRRVLPHCIKMDAERSDS